MTLLDRLYAIRRLARGYNSEGTLTAIEALIDDVEGEPGRCPECYGALEMDGACPHCKSKGGESVQIRETITHDLALGRRKIDHAIAAIRELLSAAETMAERGIDEVILDVGQATGFNLRMTGSHDTTPTPAIDPGAVLPPTFGTFQGTPMTPSATGLPLQAYNSLGEVTSNAEAAAAAGATETPATA